MFSGEAGKSVGLVITDMLHRRGRIDGPEAAQRHDMPGTILLPPMARCLPALVLHHCPAVGEPERRRHVTTGGNKFEPLGIRDEMPSNSNAWNKLVMNRRFVVETEVASLMPDGMNAGRYVDVTARPLSRARRLPFSIVDRISGILCKCVENIGEQQLLMLLLVVQT